MPPQGRVSDKSRVPQDTHNCPACPHQCEGPGTEGSPDVLTNNLPSLRVGDKGVHSSCCDDNKWVASEGSGTVFINNRKAHRLGDKVDHCGGEGKLITGSGNVITGG